MSLVQLQWIPVNKIICKCCVGHGFCSQDAEILVITHIQKKTAEAWALSSSASSSLWSELPAIVEERHSQSVFLCPESRHIYSALCSAHLNSHNTSCSFPFPFPFFLSPRSLVIRGPGVAHWSHIQPLMWIQAHTLKTRSRLPRFIGNVSFCFVFLSRF